MSLHRSLNVVAICFSPDMINNFSPDWTSIESYRHWNGWDRFEAGAAYQLAEEALQTVGTYQLRKTSKHVERERKITAKSITKWLRKEK